MVTRVGGGLGGGGEYVGKPREILMTSWDHIVNMALFPDIQQVIKGGW